MGQTVSVEQLDGLVVDLVRQREAIERKIVGLNDLKALLFGTDGSATVKSAGEGQPSEPATKPTRQSGAGDGRPMNICARCKKQWPRSKTIQKRSCPGCGSDSWDG